MIQTRFIPLNDFDRFKGLLDKAGAKLIEEKEIDCFIWVKYTISPLDEKILNSRLSHPCWAEESVIKPMIKKLRKCREIIARYTIDIVIHLIRKL